jgi:CheY-like chemotaxis protein
MDGFDRQGERKTMDRLKVLLVDDNAAFLAAASQYLADFCDANVVGAAHSGEDGVRLAESLQPDVVLLDFSMPGMDGLETARRIKALPGSPVVIMVSLNTETQYRELSLTGGCDAFVSKADFTDQIGPLLDRIRGR